MDMKMLTRIQFIVILAIIVSATICEAEETDTSNNSTRIIFHYDGHEYPAELLEKSDDDQSIPAELRKHVQPGDHIGYRLYDGNKVIKDVAGSVTEYEQIVLSNGVVFSVRGKSIFEALKKLKVTLNILHTPNFGYLE